MAPINTTRPHQGYLSPHSAFIRCLMLFSLMLSLGSYRSVPLSSAGIYSWFTKLPGYL